MAAESRIRARAIQALDFLDRYAGSDSQWAVRGHAVFDEGGHSMETGARDLGDVLRAWADQVEAGIIAVPQAEAQGVRTIASTDLMEQVRKLMEDTGVHPAAPIMLAGAALEIALRSAVDELGLPGPDKPSIATYCECEPQASAPSVRNLQPDRTVSARSAGGLMVLACGWPASRVKGLRWRLSRVRGE